MDARYQAGKHSVSTRNAFKVRIQKQYCTERLFSNAFLCPYAMALQHFSKVPSDLRVIGMSGVTSLP